MPLKLTTTSRGIQFGIKVVPGSSRDRVVGLLGDALKIAVSKPPSGGAANEAVIALLSHALGVDPRSIFIISGHTNPRKRVEITGIDATLLTSRLSASL